MPFDFPHSIMAATPHIQCDVGSRRANIAKIIQTKKQHNPFCAFLFMNRLRRFLNTLRANPTKKVKYTQTTRRQQPTNCLNVFDQLWGLRLKG